MDKEAEVPRGKVTCWILRGLGIVEVKTSFSVHHLYYFCSIHFDIFTCLKITVTMARISCLLLFFFLGFLAA